MSLRRTVIGAGLALALSAGLSVAPAAATAASAGSAGSAGDGGASEHPVITATRDAASEGYRSQAAFTADGVEVYSQQVEANSADLDEVRSAHVVDCCSKSGTASEAVLVGGDPESEDGEFEVYLLLDDRVRAVAGEPYEWATLGGWNAFGVFFMLALNSPLAPAQTLQAVIEEGQEPVVRDLPDGSVEYVLDLLGTELDPDGSIRGGYDDGEDPYPDSETTQVIRAVDDVVVAESVTTVYTDGTQVRLAHTYEYVPFTVGAPEASVTLSLSRTEDLLSTLGTAQAIKQVSKRASKATRKGRWNPGKVKKVISKITKKVAAGALDEVEEMTVRRRRNVVTVAAPDRYRGGRLLAQFKVKRGKVSASTNAHSARTITSSPAAAGRWGLADPA